jgi:hypothetical protein
VPRTVNLTDAIESLRADLESVIERGRGRSLRFTLSPIQLTLNVVASAEAEGHVGWKILEGSAKVSRESTQTLTFTLTPSWHGVDGAALDANEFSIGSVADASADIATVPADDF